ncbi:MAG: hypothetical protein JXM68_06905 [Sedimentisphaerales bacterium]|nr:hypothetical protein [Sedimentisphaerales bacterium]
MFYLNTTRKAETNTFTSFSIKLISSALIISLPVIAGPAHSLTPTNGTTISETESNDTNSQNISNLFDIVNSKNDVLINAALDTKTDIDKFSFYSPSGNSFKIQCNIKELPHNDLTNIDSALDIIVFVTDNNTLWKPDGSLIEKIADDLDIAAAIPSLNTTDLIINDISVNDQHNIAIALNQNICLCDQDGIISLLYSADDITALTTIANPAISSVALDNSGNIYFSDSTSISVLKGNIDGSQLEIFSNSSYDLLTSAIAANKLDITLDNIASTDSTFRPTHMIRVSGSSIYEDGFYVTQFSSAQGGNGQITRISQDLDLGTSYNFDTFMTASSARANPSALALATNSDFGNAIFMGTFGENMGNNFDGKIFKLSPGGEPTDFITSYLNIDGSQATKGTENPTNITGFYDVIDLAFPPAGSDFGNYLFVLSENIRDNSDLGSSSDLWFVDKTGKATLYQKSFMPAAGRMVFDSVGHFDHKLIIAPWNYTYNGKIKTIDPDGNVEDLYTVTKNILDITIAPADSIFAGALLIIYANTTPANGSLVALDYDPENPDTIRTTVWADNLSLGAIPGGNMVFDENNELYLLDGYNGGITKFDYKKHLVRDFIDIQIQHIADPEDDAINNSPVFLADTQDAPILFSCTTTDQQVNYSMIDNGSSFNSDDNSNTVGFTLSPLGHCYIYSNMGGFTKVAQWDQADSAFGSFAQLNTISLENIATTGGYTYPEIEAFTVAPASASTAAPLYAIVSNAINNLPDSATSTPSQTGDDSILALGNTTAESYYVNNIKSFSIDNFNAMTIKVKGPGDASTTSYSAQVVPSAIFSHDFEELTPGMYAITMSSSREFAGDYDLMVSDIGTVTEFIIDNQSPEITFTLDTPSGNQTVQLAIAGRGRAIISARINPANNKVISIYDVIIEQSSSGTIINIQNNDDTSNLIIDNVTVNSSIKSLNCHATIKNLRSTVTKNLNINSLALQNIENINLPNFRIRDLSANTIGALDPEDQNGISDTKYNIKAKYISSIYVDRDIYNTQFFANDYSNTLRSFEVIGTMIGSDIYAKTIQNISINNLNGSENAVFQSNFYIQKTAGSFAIGRGNFNKSLCKINGGNLRSFSITDGNLVDSTIYVYGNLATISLNSAAAAGNGNMTGDNQISYRTLSNLYTAGSISKNSNIGSASSTIRRVITSGNFSGTILAYRINDLLVGYDARARRLEPGADYTGDTTALVSINNIKITGAMLGDNSGQATITASSGNIRKIFIEDSATGRIYARTKIDSIMIGTIEGSRKRIANPDADVNLEVATPKLTRLYYTGTLNPLSYIAGTPLIIDLRP